MLGLKACVTLPGDTEELNKSHLIGQIKISWNCYYFSEVFLKRKFLLCVLPSRGQGKSGASQFFHIVCLEINYELRYILLRTSVFNPLNNLEVLYNKELF